MTLPPFPLFATGLALGLGLCLGPALASEPPPKVESKTEGKGEIKIDLKPDLSKAKVERRTEPEPESGPKTSTKAKNKAEAKPEAKVEPKTEAKPESAAEPKQPVSMGELRDMIESKISEVRANRGPAPVVRVQAKGGSRQTGKAQDKHAKAAGHGHWSYQGDTGPQHWHELNPEFKQCGLGERQSPIDIREGIPVELDPIQFDYKLSAFRVIDNGHTVQVNVEPGNRIVVNGRRYELVQFHFHRPSEERLNGRQFEMVAHLVHKDLEGKLAVVAVLIEEGKGHPIVQQVWNNLPLEKRVEQAGLQGLDLLQLLPEDRRYVTYMGSLTTPPCTEGVLWMVLKKPVSVSAQQISIFSRLYPMNARPVQPQRDRLIKDGQ
jgi:carbonic anhydrase